MNDIIWQYTEMEIPEYYYVPTECLNCGSKFINDEPDFYSDPLRVHQAIHIRKGVKIADVKCPICGCESLIRMRSHG